jgi:hypothetical protein
MGEDEESASSCVASSEKLCINNLYTDPWSAFSLHFMRKKGVPVVKYHTQRLLDGLNDLSYPPSLSVCLTFPLALALFLVLRPPASPPQTRCRPGSGSAPTPPLPLPLLKHLLHLPIKHLASRPNFVHVLPRILLSPSDDDVPSVADLSKR